jgi:serine/threonine protein kinase
MAIKRRFETLGILGQGTYGEVIKAQEKTTKEIVAIKKLKEKIMNFEEGLN